METVARFDERQTIAPPIPTASAEAARTLAVTARDNTPPQATLVDNSIPTTGPLEILFDEPVNGISSTTVPVKSFAFALLIVWISTYRGFHATGGAKGVGQATTAAVVESAVLILAIDYVLTALLF